MILIAVLAALATGLTVAVVVTRVLAAQIRRQAGAERDVTIREAVERAVVLAGQHLGQHTSAASHDLDLQSRAIGRQLTDMGGELRRVTDLVAALQRERAEQHGQLTRGLEHALSATAELTDTTQRLRRALASPQARGQWGERMADDVLRAAGLIEGVNYRKQTAIAGGTIPDFTFLLPRDQLLHMDVKFPVDNYLRHLEAAADHERNALRAAFLRDVRSRVKELAGRGYADPASTVGYLLLFIPNEAIYGFIHEHDPGLIDVALRQRVVLCSPFTLFAVLGVIRQAVDTFLLERASGEILEALGGFRTQWEKFSEHVDLVGSRLASTQKAYDELAGTRRRQLQRRLDAIDNLRAQRPRPLRDAGDVDEAAEGAEATLHRLPAAGGRR